MIKQTPKISIIVPVYNVEVYLHRCINSILSQTFPDFEVLLINDGSTDRSGMICDEFAKKDSRIRVFHKENGGVASARQLGIDKAIGKYSIHADGDDWIEKDMLNDMYKIISEKQADILIADFYISNPQTGEKRYSIQKPSNLNHQSIIKEILQNKLFGSLWHKMIRHELYKQNNTSFCSGINYCEDVLILCKLLNNPLSIAYCNKAFYHYCQDNSNSITRHYTKNTYIQRRLYYEQLKQIINPQFYKKELMRVQNVVFYEAYINNVLTSKEQRNEINKVFFSIMKENYSKRFKISLFLSYLGLNQLSMKIFPRNKHQHL